MIDNNRDGTIDAADLKGTYASLGIMNVEDEMVNSMIKEAPAALTFTVFLGSNSNFENFLISRNEQGQKSVTVSPFMDFEPRIQFLKSHKRYVGRKTPRN